ncbi:efflux RND transporter permease subunit [Nitrosomonas sp.]|uniref:efflux RND transporter permease subunit n=1 Tax=Nitrosomonas sp. TaxID=42353 RepID=UPI0033057988
MNSDTEETIASLPGGPSRLFIFRPVATSLLMITLLLGGLIAYRFLPLSSLPEVDFPTIQVTTLYPGASPDVMALTVTSPLERQFGQMPGLVRMTSTSSSGASVITLQFRLDLALDIAEQEVQAAINVASTLLPAALPTPPVYAKVNPADAPILSLGITSDTRPPGEVQGIIERQFSNKISQISGVGLVSMMSGQRPAIRIQANIAALAARGLSLERLRTVINNANVNAAKGNINGDSRNWTIDVNDQLTDADSYRNLVIGFANGAPIRLSDVANVIEATENVRLAAWMNDTPAVILDVQRQPGANVISTVDTIKTVVRDLEAQLPADVHVTLLTDRTAGIRASVEDVQFELILAVFLVTLVIFLFLGSARATVIASVAVPLSLIGAFTTMYFLDFSVNNLTLMALTIASGFVVDDAIVVLENIARHIENGMRPFEAALKGAGEIGFTIISLTISLVAVLIPLLFMEDVVGRLFREFAITLAVTILLSAVIALTLVPMLSARWLHSHEEERGHYIVELTHRWFDWLSKHYITALDRVMAHRTLTLLVFAATLIITILLYLFVPKNLFPEQDTGQIAVTTSARQDIGFQRMAELQQQVARALLTEPAVASLSSSIGVDGQNPALSQGRMLVNLKPHGERAGLPSVLLNLERATANIAGVQVHFRPVQDLTIDTSTGINAYRFSLQGADENQVTQWGEKLVTALNKDPLVRNITSSLFSGGRSVTVDINRDTASRLGLSVLTIDNALYDAFGQRIISTIYTQSSQNRVILEAMSGFITDPQALGRLQIPLPDGTNIPLSTLATIHTGAVPLVISREDQFPAATIGFDPAPGVSLEDAVKAIERTEQAIGIPISLTTRFSGAASAFKSSLGNTLWLILAAIGVVYIVLGVLYESFIHPITILSTLPPAGIGALLGLWLTGSGLGVIGIIGIVLLIGIVKKNAIMMIDFALDAMRYDQADSHHAIRQAALLRFRPIMMTTFAALFAALPLIFGGGTGHELRQPLGIAIGGGLLLSQILTLFTTPVIFLVLEDWKERRQQLNRVPIQDDAS